MIGIDGADESSTTTLMTFRKMSCYATCFVGRTQLTQEKMASQALSPLFPTTRSSQGRCTWQDGIGNPSKVRRIRTRPSWPRHYDPCPNCDSNAGSSGQNSCISIRPPGVVRQNRRELTNGESSPAPCQHKASRTCQMRNPGPERRGFFEHFNPQSYCSRHDHQITHCGYKTRWMPALRKMPRGSSTPHVLAQISPIAA